MTKEKKMIKGMSSIPYTNAIVCRMYSIVCTGPDLAYAVSQVGKFMTKPSKQYWEAVKWMCRYLRGTTDYGLVFDSERVIIWLWICGFQLCRLFA